MHEVSTPVRKETARRKFVLFSVAEQSYGIPLSAVREVVPMVHLAQPPVAPSLLAGVLNLGGEAVPTVQLAKLFGLSSAPLGSRSKLLIVRHEPTPIAFAVDRVMGLLDVAETDITSMREGVCFNDCALGTVANDDGHVILLDERRLLREEERRRLNDLAAIEQSRLGELGEEPS